MTATSAAALIRLLRPAQWAKNLFLFAPLFFAGAAADRKLFFHTSLAFILFSLISSSVYIFNDVKDVEYDRSHPRKAKRPIAAGQVPVLPALALSFFLAVFSLIAALRLSGDLVLIMMAYLTLNGAYSLFFKQVPILDVFCVSSGFILRVLAGGAVAGVTVSHWLLVCTLSLSLFLTFGKRRQELVNLGEESARHRPVLRKYSLSFLNHTITIVSTLTIVCYLLYVSDPQTVKFFGTRAPIITVFFVLYGILHYLNLLQTQALGGDPTELLFKDRALQISCLGWGLSWLVIIYLK
ncbi:MAG: decaprenyl-phosphate phosphoribosyltransferase [Thermodesulfobacteriota bacterium]